MTAPRRPHFTSKTERALVLGLLLALGLYARCFRCWASPLPFGDGGLFFRMIEALISHKFALPAHVNYNGEAIPFAYPPFGMYTAAFLHALFGGSILSVMKIMPAVVSTFSILPVYAIGKETLGEKEALLAATFFAFYIPGYNWAIMGGGVTRAWGYFWALMALFAYFRYRNTRNNHWLLATGAFAGLTGLSHPGTVFWLALMLGVIMLVDAAFPFRKRIVVLLESGGIGLLTLSPWAITIISRKQMPALLNALHTGHTNWYAGAAVLFPWGIKLILSPWIDGWSGVFSLIGLWNEKYSQRWWLVGALLFSFVVAPRAATRFTAVWIALLAAIGIELALRSIKSKKATLGLVAVVGFYLFFSASISTLNLAKLSVSPQQLAGMDWASQHLEAEASILVLPQRRGWGNNYLGEWMPALTDFRAACLPQGTEWTGEFEERVQAAEALWQASRTGAKGLRTWLERAPCRPQFVWLADLPEQALLVNSLADDKHFHLLYADEHNAFFAIAH